MGLIEKVEERIIRKKIKELPTQQEINKMADEQVKKGVPPWLATVLALAGGAAVGAVQAVFATGNFFDLVKDPKALAGALFSAFLIRIAHSATPPSKPEPVPSEPVR